MDAWVSLVTNVGFPIAIVAFIAFYFVKPLGGADGVVASFFTTQAENSRQQTALMQEQRALVEKLADSMGMLGQGQREHIKESAEYYHASMSTEYDLLRIHSLLSKAFRLEFQNEQARELLRQVDEIVTDALKKL